VVFVLAIAGSAVAMQTPVLPEQAFLQPPDAGAFHEFGNGLAIDDLCAAIGARNDDSAGPDTGAVRVYRLDGGWVEDQKLVGGDSEAGDEFGYAVALSGTTLVCGARYDDDADPSSSSTNSGAAYVFERSGTLWDEVAKLVAPDGDPGDEFGRTVAIDGDVIAVGAMLEDGGPGHLISNAGAVYVFRNIGGTWTFESKVTANVPSVNDWFGIDVTLSGDVLAVGANGRSVAGTVSVFRNVVGQWSFEAELEPATPESGEEFGFSVALDADRLAVGAPFGALGGRVLLFERDLLLGWDLEHAVVPSDAMPGQDFGFDVGLDGTELAVGAPTLTEVPVQPGSAYAFEWTGGSLVEVWKLEGANALPGDAVGFSIAVSGCTVLAGAPLVDEGSQASVGGVFAFRTYTPIVTYCSSKTNSLGCQATMDWSGSPHLESSTPFLLLGHDTINQKQGLLFYGLTGPAILPFLGGALCVNPPLKRSPILSTGGNSGPDDCSGLMWFDFVDWTLNGSDDALGANIPLHAQFWYRDPGDLFGSSLTNAVAFTLCE